MFDVMFSIISGQPDPNFLPLLDKYYSPRELVLCVTDSMKVKADHFIKGIDGLLQKNVQPIILSITDENNLNEFQDKLEEKVKEYIASNKSIVFNITGGTKLMTIAMMSLWLKYQEHITPIYLEIKENKFRIFKSYTNNRFEIEESNYVVKKNFDFESYFKARGIFFEKSNDQFVLPAAAKRQFFEKILDSSIVSKRFISVLNNLCHSREEVEVSSNIRDRFKQLFSDLKDYVEIKESIKDQKIFLKMFFKQNRWQAAKYFGGGWLEDYCYEVIKEQVGGQNVVLNSLIYRDSNDRKNSSNELDVCFFYKGTLYVIEAKTINFSKGHVDENGRLIEKDPQDIIHKLISMGDDFGLKTKLCLISFNKLPDYLYERAKDKHIQVFQDEDISDLKEFKGKLRAWITK